MIDDFIQAELDWFAPIKARESQFSEEQKKVWRSETVRERQERISIETWEACEGLVRYGPFSGMTLSGDTWWGRSDLGSQCLGFYEPEVLDHIMSKPVGYYESFVDIGAADGYYAVGMLHAKLANEVYCFELAEAGQKAIKRNWEQNGSIGQLSVLGKAEYDTLELTINRAANPTLILIDIEGAEFDLLDHDTIELIRHCEVIVEIHHWIPDFQHNYERLLRDLARYFKIRRLPAKDREVNQMAELRCYTDDNRALLISERRPSLMRFPAFGTSGLI